MNFPILDSISKQFKKHPFVYGGVVFILALPVLLHFIFWGLVASKAPEYNGLKKHPFIKTNVTVIRDANGIPHIDAGDSLSAYFALGYTIAQDRLFQMELQRRIGRGDLTELFGDKLLESDKFLKSLLLKKTAEEYANSEKHLYPGAWEELDAFLTGVNAFVEEGNFPIEYTILGTKPRPFNRIDAISFLFYMGFSFAEGIKTDSLYTILESELKDRNVHELFPRYDLEKGATILESQPGSPKLSSNSDSDRTLRNDSTWKARSEYSTNNISPQSGTDTIALRRLIDEVSNLILPIEPLEGSNSWLIAPSRSASGGAILANDPHIALSNPGAWYEAHIRFPGYENYGYFLSILPFPLIAHNKDKAWGLTMLEQDDVNLYSEIVSGDKVMEKGKWVPLQTYSDPILVKGKDPIPFEIKISSHGPIITEHIKGYMGKPVSLYWAHHHLPNPLLDVIYQMGRSTSFRELDSASSLIGAPGLNFSYADSKGNIAYYSVGRFPILKSGNSRKILDGSTGENDVIGYLPSSQNPKIINPKNGIIITANNMVTSQKLPGLGYPEGNWQPRDRFLRLADVLGRQDKWTLEDMASLQTDTVSSFAPRYLEIALPSLEKVKSRSAKQALGILKAWNFEHDLNSQGGAVYDVFFYLALKNIVIDELGEDKFKLYGDFAEYWNAYRGIIQNPDSKFWDDQNTKNTIETREDILIRSLEDTASYLEEHVSRSPSLWRWKNLYKIKHPHPLGVIPLIGKIFDIGPLPGPGGAEVVNNLKYKLMKEDWTATSGPSKRRVIDYGRFDESVTQLPIGNSGNLGSPFYGNLVKDYINGVHRKILFSEKSYSEGKYRLEFKPFLK
ncbi:penicillin acylase family protein [Leptospira ilyithenensis]|uniref:Penicillin acylase family protein n=1 Tax=Leptospira ilyithenensis TaxID=2484901 RepID=A0A4R9LP09_9LEPT|nr:penicillin acylase family protein [Leptospira ilyithenensis]TGN10505.1 penicillin acylase family protein [Leptospira ilyithenensis]